MPRKKKRDILEEEENLSGDEKDFDTLWDKFDGMMPDMPDLAPDSTGQPYFVVVQGIPIPVMPSPFCSAFL